MNQQPFNLESVLAQAAQVAQQQDNNGGDNMKLVYPQAGTLKVRLLYNNAAGIVMRKFERHTINKQKVICLQNYGMDCPVCKMIDSIQSATGSDLWQMKRTTRGIAYAEYVDSDYKWDDPNNAPKKGEIVILMFPWTIYTDLNRLIASAGQNIYGLISSNVGGVFKITRWSENRQIKYRAEIDPFDNQHQTCASEEEYQKLLMELPSLNDKFVPVEPNDNIIKAAQSMADELNKEYLSPQVFHPSMGQSGASLSNMASNLYNPNTNPAPQMPGQFTPNNAPASNPAQSYTDPNSGITYDLINNQWIPRVPQAPNQPNPVNQTAVNNNAFNQAPAANAQANVAPGSPACFGKHGSPEINPNTCLLCPSEGQCSSASKPS